MLFSTTCTLLSLVKWQNDLDSNITVNADTTQALLHRFWWLILMTITLGLFCSTEFFMMNYWLFLNSLLLGVLHSLLLKFLFLLWKLLGVEFSPSWMGFSSSSAMPAAPNPMFLTSVAMGTSEHCTLNWPDFSAETIWERMKSEGAPSFVWCTQIQMYVANSHSCKNWAAWSDFWFCV